MIKKPHGAAFFVKLPIVKTIRKVLIRKRLRLKDFDYSNDGRYYVTICVKDHVKCFGEIINGKMKSNHYGDIVERQFVWLQNRFPYIKIPIRIVMPDHVHAIIEINRNFIINDIAAVSDRDLTLSDQNDPNNIKIKPLPQLIGAFKTTSSKKIHETGKEDFRWQRSYHEHIIRNNIDYARIFNYIKNNPVNENMNRSNSEDG